MAKVKLIAGIVSVHGKIGSYCYRTYENGTITLSRMPKKSDKEMTEAQKKATGTIWQRCTESQ